MSNDSFQLSKRRRLVLLTEGEQYACPNCDREIDSCQCACPYCDENEICDCAVGYDKATGG